MIILVRELIYCVFVVCVVFASTSSATLADKEEKSEEVAMDQETAPSNETFSEMGGGALDSHEAMNNRELPPVKVRKKRSYEFLTGILFNHTTRRENDARAAHSYANIERPIIKESQRNKEIAASELLLELIVKIASNPEKWDKVHALLQRIDGDIQATKKVVDGMDPPPKQNYRVIKKDELQPEQTTTASVEKFSTTTTEPSPEENQLSNLLKRNNKTAATNKSNFYENSWEKSRSKMLHKLSTYAKNFAYHRVTGKPFTNVDKKTKAYIAVSVVAPQEKNNSGGEGVALENELLQLKPWPENGGLGKKHRNAKRSS